MSSKSLGVVTSWIYRESATDDVDHDVSAKPHQEPVTVQVGLSPAEVEDLLRDRIAEAEVRWTRDAQAREAVQRDRISHALDAFAKQRAQYFGTVEYSVVHLALGIARKILKREAALDPTLLHGLVRVALDGVKNVTSPRIHLSPEQARLWQSAPHAFALESECVILPDTNLAEDECRIETSQGSTILSVGRQLDEIEGCFSDLLARRPEVR